MASSLVISYEVNRNCLSDFVTLALVVYVVIPALALLGLSIDVQRERRSRPVQTKVPVVKGLTYEDAETKLHAANLNIRLLATRHDPAVQPGLVIDQVPAPGEEVTVGHSVGITLSRKDYFGPDP